MPTRAFDLDGSPPATRAVRPARAGCIALAALGLPGVAWSHFFTQPYVLPVPFSFYLYGATAALLLSFCVSAAVARRPAPPVAVTPAALPAGALDAPHGGPGYAVMRGLALALLMVCIAAGLLGTRNPFGNINMTLFWIVFVLGVPYATAVAGDFYGPLNPWRTCVRIVEGALGRRFEGRLSRPGRLGHLPALALYMAFIWIELFGELTPRGLSIALLAYTAVNVAGAWLLGTTAWFERGEFFGVMLRIWGRMSPWAGGWWPRHRSSVRGARWRWPFVGLLEERDRTAETSFVCFVLFMLASTAFDGLHGTRPWTLFFWKSVYPALAPHVPAAPGKTYAVSVQLYDAWQTVWLLLSPLLYLAPYAAAMWLARRMTGGMQPVRSLMATFALSLVPIAFVYHLTHYYTLLLAQGGQIATLASDPLGLGWNLFGTAKLVVPPVMLSVESIWNTQIALIVLGHVVSVYLAHVEALRVLPTPRQAAISQLPMLLLMMLLTTLGLWILSMPLAGK